MNTKTQLIEILETANEALNFLFTPSTSSELKEQMRELLTEAVQAINGIVDLPNINEFIQSLNEDSPDNAERILREIETYVKSGNNSEKPQIKLVIWDLDDTFWQGTLAEGDNVIIPPQNISFIKELTNRGIINSICSKNDFEKVRMVLQNSEIWDYFVFPHIAFTAKGEFIKQIIKDMQLRDSNVLFIDDNKSNLEEARFYNPELQILHANDIELLLKLPNIKGNPDPEHKRLEQYKMLQKRHDYRKEQDDNISFLYNSDIHIKITPTIPNNEEEAERVHDMIMRTNQLNFTKKRISLDEVKTLLNDPNLRSETVRVYDRFGDHGVVGWFCLSKMPKSELIHFLFSCRIINLGIEQYVYAFLEHPSLNIVGDTASLVSNDDIMADYITLDNTVENIYPKTSSEKTYKFDYSPHKLQIYALGACDLYYLISHIALPLTNVHFECNTFLGDTRGVNVATEYIRSCFEMNEKEQAYCRENFHNYTGSTVFDTQIFKKKYDFVCLSFHDDFALDIYQSNEFSNMRVVLSNSKSGTFTPILNPHNEKDFDSQKWLAKNFTKLGLITAERFDENLEWIISQLIKVSPKTKMILMTGPEYDYFRNSEPHNPVFRRQVILLNKVMRDFCDRHSNAFLVEMNEFVNRREHFTDFIFHLKPERGYMLALKMLEIISKNPSDKHLREKFSLNRRKLVLWSDVNIFLPNYYTLCGNKTFPDYVINLPPLQNDNLQEKELKNNRDKYFVLLTPSKFIDEQRKILSDYGYKENIDYDVLINTPFVLEWRE